MWFQFIDQRAKRKVTLMVFLFNPKQKIAMLSPSIPYLYL